MSDDAFYDPAEFIAYGSVYKGRYRFTGYFYPDQGSLFPRTSTGAETIAAMESEYARNFRGPGKPNGYGYARALGEAALFYDAVKVAAQAIEQRDLVQRVLGFAMPLPTSSIKGSGRIPLQRNGPLPG